MPTLNSDTPGLSDATDNKATAGRPMSGLLRRSPPVSFLILSCALTAFLLLDLLRTLAMTALVAGLGYSLGRRAVDLVLLVDKYASVVSLTMIAVAALLPLIRRRMRRGQWAVR